MSQQQLFHEYFREWVDTYKAGAVRPITLQKYNMTHRRIKELAPSVRIGELDRKNYQELLNRYAETREKQTTRDFNNHLKAAILDAIDDGLLENNPARKAVIKGKPPNPNKKIKYLSQFELCVLLKRLNLGSDINWDWFIYILAKTGMRFSEGLGLTPKDFDFQNRTLHVNKTWNYKGKAGGFDLTKNKGSVRKILMDEGLSGQLEKLLNGLPDDKPIFATNERVFSSTVNNRLFRLCEAAGIPKISIHGLRHTHASVLICAGVSIASVAKRLGHANVSTTQETYLHIIKELEDKDNDKIMGAMAGFN